MTEAQWDKKLKIQTGGRDDYHEDEYHYPYEPTPYSVLERLAGSGYIDEDSYVIDYGCGKGRVGFFLNHQCGCAVTGIEYDERIYKQAMQNLEAYGKTREVDFQCISAEVYQVSEADCFYFFNPFSVELLQSVMGKILDSYYDVPRQMQLFFYYPNDEYLSYLMTIPELMFVDEIDCQDLFEGKNGRERILIFEI